VLIVSGSFTGFALRKIDQQISVPATSTPTATRERTGFLLIAVIEIQASPTKLTANKKLLSAHHRFIDAARVKL
jgi:hypothetical protein